MQFVGMTSLASIATSEMHLNPDDRWFHPCNELRKFWTMPYGGVMQGVMFGEPSLGQ